jgi:hypothetical protein
MIPNGAAVAKWLQQKPDNSEEQLLAQPRSCALSGLAISS